jgi:hypothetical protein
VRGFLVGSLALIVLSVGVSAGTADKVLAGTGVLNAMLRRALAPNVAGLPRLAKPKTAAPASTPVTPGAPITITMPTPVPTTGPLTLV